MKAASKVREYIGKVEQTGLGWDVREALTDVEIAQERLLMGLRTIEGVALEDLAPLGLSAQSPKLAELVDAALIVLIDGRLYATGQGRLVLDRVAAELA